MLNFDFLMVQKEGVFKIQFRFVFLSLRGEREVYAKFKGNQQLFRKGENGARSREKEFN